MPWGRRAGVAASVGRSVTISQTSMLVLSQEARPRGTLVRFEFAPGLKARGKVIWTQEDEEGGTFLGIRFHRLKRSTRNLLLGLLETGSPR